MALGARNAYTNNPNNYFDRVYNQGTYKIDPKTGRAVQRNTLGQLTHMVGSVFGNIGNSEYDKELSSKIRQFGVQPRNSGGQASQPMQPVAQVTQPTGQTYNSTVNVDDVVNPNAMYQSAYGSQYGSTQTAQPSGYDDVSMVFGPKFNSIDDVMNHRQKLVMLRDRALAGEPVDDSEIGDALGLDFMNSMQMSPEHRDMLKKAKADYFERPIIAIDNYVKNKSEQQKVNNSFTQAGVFSGLPKDVTSQLNKMVYEYNTNDEAKKYKSAVNALSIIKSVDPQNASGPQAQGLISDYAKILDPQSVVREAEFIVTSKYSQSLANKILGEIKQGVYGQGSLSPDAIKVIQQAAENRVRALTDSRAQDIKSYENYLENYAGVQPGQFSGILYQTQGGMGQSGQSGQPTQKQFYRGPDGLYYEVNQMSGSPKASGVSGSPVTNVSDAMQRIARNESDGSGGYQALGPVISSGDYKGQRAIGKYQVMEGNIGPWSREMARAGILSRPVTPQEFYGSPKIQDAMAAFKLQQHYDKTGSWSDAASMWHSGRKLANAGNARDQLGTATVDYVRKFNS